MASITASPEKTSESHMGSSKEHQESPTRVSDFEDAVSGEGDVHKPSFEVSKDAERPAIPDISTTPSQYQKPRPLFLATIDDNSSVSSAESSKHSITGKKILHQGRPKDRTDHVQEEGEVDHQAQGENTPHQSRPRRSSFVAKDGDAKHPQLREARALDEVRRYKDMASRLASRGKEPDALRMYGRALKVMLGELARIKKQLEFSGQTPTLTGRLMASWEQASSSIAGVRTAMAILFERLGDYDKAIKSCNEAREAYTSYSKMEAHIGSAASVVDVDAHLQQMDVMLSRLATARDSFMDRKSMHEGMLQTRRRMLLTKEKTARERLYEEVVHQIRKVLDKECECLGEGHPQVADTLGTLARIYKEGGEIDVAIDEQKAAMSILRVAVGPSHPRTAMATRELGKLFDMRDTGDSDQNQAIALYEKTIAISRDSLGNQHTMVGSTLNDLAVIHIRRKEYDKASEKLSDALTSYESGIQSGSGVNPDVAQVWKNMGECYALRGEWESALFAYSSALRVQQDARHCHGTSGPKKNKTAKSAAIALSGVDDVSIADTLSRLAKATAILGQYEDAIESYEEALHHYRSSLDDAIKRSNGKPTQHMVDMQDRVAHTLYLIAETREKNEDYDRATALYSEALELRLTSDAQRDDQRMNMVHCAMNLAGIGSVHMRKSEFTDACLVLKESIKFLEAHGIPRDHEIYGFIQARLAVAENRFLKSNSLGSDELRLAPPVPKKPEDKTVAFDETAERQVAEGDYDGALRTLTTVLAIRRKRLTKRQKKHSAADCTKEKSDVAKTLASFANILALQGEKDQAESLYRESLRIFKSNGLSEEDSAMKSLSEELAKTIQLNS